MLHSIDNCFCTINEIIKFDMVFIIINVPIINCASIMILEKIVLIKYILFKYLFKLFILCH